MLPILLSILGFSIIHSWLAGQTVKQTIRNYVGERTYYGFYRIAYNLVAIVTLVPALTLILITPGAVVWQVEGIGAVALLGIQLVAIVGVMISLMQTDLWRFAGIRQVGAYLAGQPLPLPEESLQTDGLYKLVRHPLYLFSLLVIWPMYRMTETFLMFNVAVTLYFMVGSLLEEKRLAAAFGETYTAYQKQVPWMIPFPRLRH